MKQPLYQQTEHLGASRISGEAGVLHDIEDYFRQVEFFPIDRGQIKKILESVPGVFSESWKSPDDYLGLSQSQQTVYFEIAEMGFQQCPGPVIQKVIELAVQFRDSDG